MTTTSIVFDHRNRTKSGDEGPLEVRVTISRKPYYINTGVRVKSKQWFRDRVINHPQADVLNERLHILVNNIMHEINKCIDAGKEINVASIRKAAWKTAHDESALDWMQSEVQRLPVRLGTLKHYTCLLLRLEDFGQIWSWADVTVENIYAFDAWLRNLSGRYGNITQSGIHTYHKCLRALLNRAEKSGQITSNPYNRLRGEFSKGERESTEYLTEDEMSKIEAFSPAPGSWMERSRDIFIFQMYTGLSFSDAQAFDISAYKEVDGKWRVIGNRIKTGQPYVNQLLPPAVEVLKRYDMTVPKISNQVYNRELKQIGIAAGISTPLHSHLARHTFATYMLRNGVKIENLAKMLGHSNIKQTQRYAKVLAESVHEDFDMIENLINQRKQ